MVNAVEPPRTTKYGAQILGWEEVHAFLDQITDPLQQTLALLAIQAGLRRSEILGIQWRDVDLSAGTLAVRRALTNPESTDGRREGWANWDEGACKGRKPGLHWDRCDTAEGFQ